MNNIQRILTQLIHQNQQSDVNDITSVQQTTSNDEQCIVCLETWNTLKTDPIQKKWNTTNNTTCNHKICTTCYAGYVRKYSEYDDDDNNSDDSEETNIENPISSKMIGHWRKK